MSRLRALALRWRVSRGSGAGEGSAAWPWTGNVGREWQWEANLWLSVRKNFLVTAQACEARSSLSLKMFKLRMDELWAGGWDREEA